MESSRCVCAVCGLERHDTVDIDIPVVGELPFDIHPLQASHPFVTEDFHYSLDIIDGAMLERAGIKNESADGLQLQICSECLAGERQGSSATTMCTTPSGTPSISYLGSFMKVQRIFYGNSDVNAPSYPDPLFYTLCSRSISPPLSKQLLGLLKILMSTSLKVMPLSHLSYLTLSTTKITDCFLLISNVIVPMNTI
jgi:hypothetical protein